MNATQQKSKPILFSTEMVQAILAGRKMQTRRVVNPQPIKFRTEFPIPVSDAIKDNKALIKKGYALLGTSGPLSGYTYGKSKYHPGDILWVRESATVYKIEATTGFHLSGEPPVGYRSIKKIGIEYCGGERVELDYPERLSLNTKCGQKLTYGVFKEAARIFLKVTNVRCERLQDISEEDAIAEGIDCHTDDDGKLQVYCYPVKGKDKTIFCDSYISEGIFNLKDPAAFSFQKLWDSINAKKHPWESNPWVWVYTFERIEKPENFN